MNARFRARLSDPIGPRWTRLLLPALALVTLALDYVWAALDSAAPGPAFFLAAVLLLFARPLLGRHRPRTCELTLEAGRVVVSDAGILNQTIETADIDGASTSIGEDGGVSLALARKARLGRPLLLEVETSAQAAQLREALGIGYGGYGTLAWRVSAKGELPVTLARFAGAFAALSLGLDSLRDDSGSILSWLTLACASAFVFLWPVLRSAPHPGVLWFNDAGVFYTTDKRTEHLDYKELARVATEREALCITKTDGVEIRIPLRRTSHSLAGASELELQHIKGQLEAAARRARGEIEPGEGSIVGVELLARGSSDAPRAWLDRLDAAAGSLGGGYRSVNLTKDSLVRALTDPDAPSDVRIGAARVLHRIEAGEALARVAEVCETVRDPALRQQLRVVLSDDVDEAASELERLDEHGA